MAICKKTARWIVYVTTTSFVVFAASNLHAQRFTDPGFRSYSLRAASPTAIEDSLRRFLADRIAAGEPIDIVSDPRAGRLLVRGSQEVQQLVDQFVRATDRPAAQGAIAQATRTVHGYLTSSIEELNQQITRLRQQFGNRNDVRITADVRTRQIVVHASPEVHQLIAASWNNQPAVQHLQPPATDVPRAEQNQVPDKIWTPPKTQLIQLQHIFWRDLVRGLRNVQGQNAAISSPQDGMLEMNLASSTGNPVQLRIDQQNQVVQISGSTKATQQWTRVVQAMDRQPVNPGEQRTMGRLGDAQPATITRTIAMLGGAGDAAQTAQWGNNAVQRMFSPDQRQPPSHVAQQLGNVAAQGGDETAMLATSDSVGSFLGPVRIEFLEGTDIFIVRGQKRDVDRVMKIIQDIERLTAETDPTVEVLQLNHANSAAVAQIINDLNTGPLSARQGDISVTALVKPNALLLIGRPAGVESVKKIVKELDVEVEPSTLFRVFHLKYLPSVDAERTINNLYNMQQVATAGQDESAGLKIRVRAVADFRSNSIVVQGSPRDLEEIGDLLRQLDVEGSTTVSEVRVFQLKNALAQEVADVLNDTLGTDQSSLAGQQGGFQQGGISGGANGNANTQPFSSRRAMMLQMTVLDEEQKKLIDQDVLESGILSNVVVAPNERANSIVVTAPKGSMELIAEIIRQLDELAPQEAEIRVFTIVNGDAASLIQMLDTLFEQQDQQDGPLIQSAAGTGESTLVPLRFSLDGRTNTIIASGNAADLRVVEAILLKLDASDVSRRRTIVYELQIQQAQSVAAAITTFVQQRRQALLGIAPDAITAYELLEQEVVVVAEPDSNKVIISATEQYFDDIIEIVKKLDKRPDMVLVQCLIAEIALNSTEEMGIELGIQDSLLFNRSVVGVDGFPVPGFNFNNQPLGGGTGLGSTRDKVAGQALSSFSLGRSNGELGYGGLVLSASNESVTVLVRALQETRRLDVLSRPQIMMLNNTTGEVQVGAVVPYVTDSVITGNNVSNSVTFQNVGLILGVTPRISPDGLVVLDVLAEKSSLGSIEDGIPIAVTATQTLRAPQINTTRARTFVTARDGQTVILGGLITKERSAFDRKVPYLADIPFLGRLFRTDGISEQRTELLIILTPHIVRDESDIERVNSEEYARMSWCLGNVIETHGEIGSGGGFKSMLEEDMVYSELNPTDVPEEVPQPAPASVIPAPTESWKSLLPQTENPTAPVPIIDVIPQAKKSDVLLNSPQNVSQLLGTTHNKRGFEQLSGTVVYPNYEQPVESKGGVLSTTKTKQSVFRFEEVPFYK